MMPTSSERQERASCVVDSFEEVVTQTLEADFALLYVALEKKSDIEVNMVLDADGVYSRGTHADGRAKADRQ